MIVSDEDSHFDKLRLFLVQSAAALVGTVLFAIGLSGRLNVPLYPVEQISFLAQPMPVSDAYNHYYWTLLTLVGLWLMLFVFIRLAAAVALALIAFKWAVFQGYVVEFVTGAAAFP